MFFTCTYEIPVTNTTKQVIRYWARQRIILYKMGPNELLLNDYFIQTKHTGLLQICLYLLKKCTVSKVGNNFIVTFINKQDDNLAALITYGNTSFSGSNILKDAFK